MIVQMPFFLLLFLFLFFFFGSVLFCFDDDDGERLQGKALWTYPYPRWMALPTRTVHWVIPGLDTRTLREHAPRPSNQANPVWA